MFYDKFINLCDKKGVTPIQVRKDLGISQSTMASWKSRGLTPNATTLAKLADYFGVIMADLLDGNESKIYKAGFIDGAVAESMQNQSEEVQLTQHIAFNTTPDPKWAELHKKLEDGTITPEEQERYKELWTQSVDNAHKTLSAAMTRLSFYMDKLNDDGQRKAIERVEELTEIPKYQKTNEPPQPE